MCEHVLVDWVERGTECVWGRRWRLSIVVLPSWFFGCSKGGLFYSVFTTRSFPCSRLYLFWQIEIRDLFGRLGKSNPLYYF
jgi:hypothetical protein